MAPAKLSASSLASKNVGASLSSPGSLLWAHQLRREHSALLTRIDDLTRAVSSVSTTQLNKIAAQAIRAEKTSSEIESAHAKLIQGLDRACEHGKALEGQIARVAGRLDISEEGILGLQRDVHTIQERHNGGSGARLAAVERRIQEGQEERELEVQELKAQVRDLQNRLPDVIKDGVIGVRDSMEMLREQMNQTGLIQSDSEQKEDMLTLRPNLDMQSDKYHRDDIDLVKNFPTTEPEADEVGQTERRGTMAMLPETPPAASHEQINPNALKQGKFESWDQYLAAGKGIKGPLPKEGAAVEAFVDGIHDEMLKENCERMLDKAGWSWNNVKGFVMKYVAAEVETQAKQRTESLTHKYETGEVCPVCTRKANAAKDGDIATTIANRSPQLAVRQAVQLSKDADSTRRSEWIRQQPQAHLGEITKILEPKTLKKGVEKPFETPQVETRSPSAQEAMAKAARQHVEVPTDKTIAGEPGAVALRDFVTLEGGIPQSTLKVVKKDQETRKDAKMTPELPLNKDDASLQKTMAPGTANFQPIRLMNNSVTHNSLGRKNIHTKSAASAGGVPEIPSSKKRKVGEHLEVSVAAKGDLVIPLDKVTPQHEAREPEMKKRRKKRAVMPIPMIPVLPLSDDE